MGCCISPAEYPWDTEVTSSTKGNIFGDMMLFFLISTHVCASLNPALLQAPAVHMRGCSSPCELHFPPPQPSCDPQKPQKRGQSSSWVIQPLREREECDQRAAKGPDAP